MLMHATGSRRGPVGGISLVAFVILALLLLAVSPAGGAATARSAACQELVVNGGFEKGTAGWTGYSELGYELVDSFFAHDGELGAWLGLQNNAYDSLTQTVALPADVESLQLSYWWALMSEEPPGGAFDFARSRLLRPDDSIITTTLSLDNDSAEAWVWNQASADISAYAGQVVQLQLHVESDATRPTNFFFDDVSILACAEDTTATATPTASAVPTATGTPPPARLFLPLTLR